MPLLYCCISVSPKSICAYSDRSSRFRASTSSLVTKSSAVHAGFFFLSSPNCAQNTVQLFVHSFEDGYHLTSCWCCHVGHVGHVGHVRIVGIARCGIAVRFLVVSTGELVYVVIFLQQNLMSCHYCSVTHRSITMFSMDKRLAAIILKRFFYLLCRFFSSGHLIERKIPLQQIKKIICCSVTTSSIAGDAFFECFHNRRKFTAMSDWLYNLYEPRKSSFCMTNNCVSVFK
jgi:hypothetical protein